MAIKGIDLLLFGNFHLKFMCLKPPVAADTRSATEPSNDVSNIDVKFSCLKIALLQRKFVMNMLGTPLH